MQRNVRGLARAERPRQVEFLWIHHDQPNVHGRRGQRIAHAFLFGAGRPHHDTNQRKRCRVIQEQAPRRFSRIEGHLVHLCFP